MFKDEIYSKGPKKKYSTSKTDVYFIDDIWKVDILDLREYGPEKNRGYRKTLVIIDNFSKFGWNVPLKNKKAQIKMDSFENTLITSKSKPNLIETDRGEDFYEKCFQNFSNSNIKHYSRNTTIGVVFSKRFFRRFRDPIKKPVFGKGESNWIDL